MLKEWLGTKPGFKGLFANSFGREKVLIGISENIQAILEGQGPMCKCFLKFPAFPGPVVYLHIRRIDRLIY